jgi:uracil-DNA glycosylase family 4
VQNTINQRIVACELCPRLTTHCREVAIKKRAAYRDQSYWGKPVPSLGRLDAQVLLLGLAPGAHGANRTGRMFTGDRSGDFLFRALYETGFANQPTSLHANDGLELIGAYITAAAHCAPPDNKPLPEELANCRPYLLEELKRLKQLRVVICLGRIALEAYLNATGLGPKSQYPFAHAAHFANKPHLLCSYHPSQQNTQTGRLTQPMLQSVFLKARSLL